MKQLLIILIFFAISNCSSNETKERTSPLLETSNPVSTVPSRTSNKTPSLKNKLQAIQKLIGKSCDSSSQCKVIGVGISACGGFASYNVYSEKQTDVKALKQSVEQFNQIMRVRNQKNKVVGICRHIEPPKVACQVNQCVALNSNQSL